MSNISAEIARKLELIESIKAETKALRDAEKAAEKARKDSLRATVKEIRTLMRQYKLTVEDLATA